MLKQSAAPEGHHCVTGFCASFQRRYSVENIQNDLQSYKIYGASISSSTSFETPPIIVAATVATQTAQFSNPASQFLSI